MDDETYDVPAGYTMQINRRRSYAGRRRWLMLGPAQPPHGQRPIVAVGYITPAAAAMQTWIGLGFAPDAAREAAEKIELELGQQLPAATDDGGGEAVDGDQRP